MALHWSRPKPCPEAVRDGNGEWFVEIDDLDDLREWIGDNEPVLLWAAARGMMEAELCDEYG